MRYAMVLAVALVSLAFAGCANRAGLKFTSEPPGARVYDESTNQMIGITPTPTVWIGFIPESAYSVGVWDPGKSYVAFLDGYERTTIHPRLGLQGVPEGGGGGYEWTFRFDMERKEPLVRFVPQAVVPQQQQQQQQQTVVMPAPAAGEGKRTGTVMVTANIDGTEVFVDGMLVGNAPANLQLSEGIHIIEVQAKGHESFRRELRVMAGSEVAFRAVLEPR